MQKEASRKKQRRYRPDVELAGNSKLYFVSIFLIMATQKEARSEADHRPASLKS